jgi:hypothetical protein
MNEYKIFSKNGYVLGSYPDFKTALRWCMKCGYPGSCIMYRGEVLYRR